MKIDNTILDSKRKTSIVLILTILYVIMTSPVVRAEDPLATPPTTASPPPSDQASGVSSPCSNTPCEKVFRPPSFKIVFHNISGQTHILVPRKTSLKQLENLIRYLAEERKLDQFEKIGIPPNGSGDYLRGSILVFDEIKWARGEKLTNPKIKEKTYSRKVLAEYIWNNHSETAYIGSRNLFSHTLPR
ncbi:MAG: hypothetical protein HYR80_08500 [Nitrospirae bacterium]|nr:hypothetical protein [Nitrospirota bacterium]